MVRCNLSVLLAERNLKITKVCKDTGISRTTLTYLVNNYSKGIQYDTLNTLCTYLSISPGDLISYVPVDISYIHVERTGDNNEQLEIEFELTFKGITRKCNLCGNVSIYFSTLDKTSNLQLPYEVVIDVDLLDADGDPDWEAENNFILNAFQALPVTFLKDIEHDISSIIVNDISEEYGLDDYRDQIEPLFVSFYWDFKVSKK